MMRILFSMLAICLAGSASPGQLHGDSCVGERFGRIEVVAPGSQWLLLDREASGNNEFGGPVVDLKATTAIAGFFPTLHVSAFKRADATVTPEAALPEIKQRVDDLLLKVSY